MNYWLNMAAWSVCVRYCAVQVQDWSHTERTSESFWWKSKNRIFVAPIFRSSTRIFQPQQTLLLEFQFPGPIWPVEFEYKTSFGQTFLERSQKKLKIERKWKIGFFAISQDCEEISCFCWQIRNLRTILRHIGCFIQLLSFFCLFAVPNPVQGQKQEIAVQN